MTSERPPRRIFRLGHHSAEHEIDEELTFHLDTRIEALIAGGLSREEARTVALREFGDLADARRELATIDRRRLASRRHIEWWDAWMQDLRFAARTLRSHRTFAATALLTLALGVGATTAIFSVVDGVLLRPLPYPNHDRLVLLWTAATLGGDRQGQLPFSAANFEDVRARTRAFEGVAAFRAWGFTLGDGDEPELANGARVSPELFDVLGVRPHLGRGLEATDALPGAERVIVLGHALWQRRYGGERAVLGRQITVNSERTTIVGVMPPDFAFPRGAELPSGFQIPPRTELWAPLTVSEETLRNRGTWDLAVVGLLRRGQTTVAAASELSRIMAEIGAEMGAEEHAFGGEVIAMREQSVRSVRAGLLLLLGSVGLVLLIACANVSNLLIARTVARRRELAIRAALGAGRGRLVRQLITENVVLALAGGTLGVMLALALERGLIAIAPAAIPRLTDVSVDARVIAFTMLLALAIGASFGLAAAVHASHADVTPALREGSRGSSGRSGARALLVVGEIAVSLVLLIGAALLAQSFLRMQRVDPGFSPDGVITAGVVMPRHPDRTFAEQQPGWNAVVEPFLERVRALPGVVAAGGTSSLPLTGSWEATTITIVGRPAADLSERSLTHYSMIAPGYFQAMRIPLIRGRDLGAQDHATAARAVVINRSAADRYWRDTDPLGAQLRIFDTTSYTIVGIVGDVRAGSLTEPVEPMLYIPFAQFSLPYLGVTVRTTASLDAIVPALRRELGAIDPGVPLTNIQTFESIFDASLAQRRLAMLIVLFFAVCALALAGVGLYGVIALAVSQRTREIGIRLALGAGRSDVIRMVVRQALALTTVGVVLGLGGALAGASVVRSQLFGVSAVDPATYAGIVLLLAAAALVASWVPARRASRVDPVEALRQD